MTQPQSARLKTEHREPVAEHEWYAEPPWAIDALLDAERFTGVSYDPCCGGGTMPDAFARRGLRCEGSDIVDRAAGRFAVADFFDATSGWGAVTNVVSNPPFALLLPFIDKALAISEQKVAVLARLAFLETPARKQFFLSRPLAQVLVFSKRVSMPPAGRGIEAKGGTVAFAWFVFSKEHYGPNGQRLPATIGFIP